MDAGRAPAGIRQAHLANQIDDFPRDGRPALWMATLPTPIESEPSPMPSDDGFGFDDHQGRSPTTPELREPDPQEAVSDAQTQLAGMARALKD